MVILYIVEKILNDNILYYIVLFYINGWIRLRVVRGLNYIGFRVYLGFRV